MSIPLSTIQDGLYDWIKTVTSRESIWVDQNPPRPTLPYLTIRLATLTKIGVDAQTKTNALGKFEVVGNRDFIISVQAFGDASLAALESLITSLDMVSIQASLLAYSVVIVDQTAVTNITGLEDTRFVERGNVDFTFRTSSTVVDDVGYFNKTNITGTYKDAKGSTILVDEFTVDNS